MQCGDLERYLEAFLDGRLGRSRSATLRRHLGMCAGCRARVERLRQFERDMQRRFRSMRQEESIWRGLELDLVAAARANPGHLLALPRLLPVPTAEGSFGRQAAGPRGAHPIRSGRGNGMGRGSRLLGILLIAMAVGAVYQLARDHVAGTEPPDPAAQVYQELARGEPALALRSQDAHQLEGWLSHELGMPVTLPPTPAGFNPVGADRVALGGSTGGAVLYRSEAPVGTGAGAAPSVVLLVEPTDKATGAMVEPPGQGGLHEISWQRAALQFTVISDRPVEAMRRFVD